MSYKDLREVLDLIITMLKEHEQRLDSLTKQVENIDYSLRQIRSPRGPPAPEAAKDDHMEMKTVLVIDDDPNIVKTYKLVLESVGFNTDTARNGFEALFKIKKVHYDLVIIDMNLPDMLGNQLAERIRESRPGTKIIMITGYSTYKEELEGLNIDEILMKPIPAEELVEITKKALQNEE